MHKLYTRARGPCSHRKRKKARGANRGPSSRCDPCRYEQPDVEPQFGHLWQAPLRTISVPHSWHGGASVSWTHARSFTSTGIAASTPDFTSTEMKSLDRSGTFGRSSCAARAAGWRSTIDGPSDGK